MAGLFAQTKFYQMCTWEPSQFVQPPHPDVSQQQSLPTSVPSQRPISRRHMHPCVPSLLTSSSLCCAYRDAKNALDRQHPSDPPSRSSRQPSSLAAPAVLQAALPRDSSSRLPELTGNSGSSTDQRATPAVTGETHAFGTAASAAPEGRKPLPGFSQQQHHSSNLNGGDLGSNGVVHDGRQPCSSALPTVAVDSIKAAEVAVDKDTNPSIHTQRRSPQTGPGKSRTNNSAEQLKPDALHPSIKRPLSPSKDASIAEAKRPAHSGEGAAPHRDRDRDRESARPGSSRQPRGEDSRHSNGLERTDHASGRGVDRGRDRERPSGRDMGMDQGRDADRARGTDRDRVHESSRARPDLSPHGSRDRAGRLQPRDKGLERESGRGATAAAPSGRGASRYEDREKERSRGGPRETRDSGREQERSSGHERDRGKGSSGRDGRGGSKRRERSPEVSQMEVAGGQEPEM